MANIELITKKVGEIKGRFFIPSYQRGYRWGNMEVKRLFEDIMESRGEPYCLQPIVVRNNGDKYELVDGQQRLTTLFLIYKYLYKGSGGWLDDAKFSMEYETREKSADFLSNIDMTRREENIDFWFIGNAYKTIESYFEGKERSLSNRMFDYLQQSVNVIWYEIPAEEDANRLFTRLNIGKIPLTSSELVKALFLRDGSKESTKDRQEEIALQWDNMERELQDESLWSFLTNADAKKYATRIDLILDLMAGKKPDEKEEYFTFFYFDKRKREKNETKEGVYSIWQEIQRSFLVLKEWRYNHDFYHKIGYLIESGYSTLGEIFKKSYGLTKREFSAYLDDQIKESVKYNNSLEELSYNNDRPYIERLLLLFNVESVRTLDEGRQWFPFDKHKAGDWSLEHIHAQHSEGLNTNEKRRVWMESHIPSLRALGNEKADELIAEMQNLIAAIDENPKNGNIKDKFEPLQQSAVELLSEQTGEDYIHSLKNLALLDCGDNAALSNFLFDAKRNKVIEWDKDGKYIPFCTKMVFFKYYSDSEKSQLHFWGKDDRDAYMEAIKKKLAIYCDYQTEE